MFKSHLKMTGIRTACDEHAVFWTKKYALVSAINAVVHLLMIVWPFLVAIILMLFAMDTTGGRGPGPTAPPPGSPIAGSKTKIQCPHHKIKTRKWKVYGFGAQTPTFLSQHLWPTQVTILCNLLWNTKNHQGCFLFLQTLVFDHIFFHQEIKNRN